MNTGTPEAKCTLCEGFGFIDHGNGNSHTCMNCEGTGMTDTSDNAQRPSKERCNFFGEGRGQCLKPAYHILAVQKQQRYHTCEEDGRLLDVALTGLAAVREAERRRDNTPETGCATHSAEHRMRGELPCPWCVIDELKRNRDAASAETPIRLTPHHVRWDFLGWLCSVCGGWNDGTSRSCRWPHEHALKASCVDTYNTHAAEKGWPPSENGAGGQS